MRGSHWMTTLATRGAYTCARCELRQLFLRGNRQGLLSIQKRFESLGAQPRQQDHEDRSEAGSVGRRTGQYYYKSFKPGVGGRRGRRHVERSEQLKIKSLDKDSEVIILRDFPEHKTPRPKPRNSQDGEDRQVQQTASQEDSTSKDIQASISNKAPPTKDEIIAAIEAHRPIENIIPRAKVEQLKAELSESFLHSQIQLYLRNKLPAHTTQPKDSGPTKTKAVTPKKPSDTVKRLSVTPWYPKGGAPISAKRIEDTSLTPRQRLQGLGKQALLDGILRQVWGIQTEAESERLGKVEIVLSPQQWDLLNTREDKALFAALRKPRFFQRTRYDRDPRKGALVIRGPRTEAEQVAKLFETAFAEASSFEIDLNALRKAIATKDAFDIDSRLWKTKLQEIMYLTRSAIHADGKQQTLQIAAFRKNLVEDAVRLLVMMLDRPRNQSWQNLSLPLTNLLGWEPVYANKVLPSWARSTQYKRRILKDFRSRTNAIAQQRNWRELQDTEVLVEKIKHALRQIEQNGSDKKSLTPQESGLGQNWDLQYAETPWTARYGFLLTEDRGKTFAADTVEPSVSSDEHKPLDQSIASSKSDQSSQFAVKVPALTTVLSWFQRVRVQEIESRSSMDPRLIAKLIPSPLAIVKGASPAALPAIDFEFVISRTGEPDDSDPASIQSRTSEFSATGAKSNAEPCPFSFQIDKSTLLTLTSIQATVGETKLNVPLPHRAVDLQFSSKIVANGNLQSMMQVPDIKAFVERIVSTMQRGKELRAPPSINIPLPRAMSGDLHKPAGDEVAYAYFFAGFEHQQHRRLQPLRHSTTPNIEHMKGAWVVSDIDGGVSGGRRIELSARLDAQGMDAGWRARDSFVVGAFSMVNMIHRAVTGEMKPYTEHVDRVPGAEHQENTPHREVHQTTASSDSGESRNDEGIEGTAEERSATAMGN